MAHHRRYTGCGCPGRHIIQHDRIGADERAIADPDRAQHRAPQPITTSLPITGHPLSLAVPIVLLPSNVTRSPSTDVPPTTVPSVWVKLTPRPSWMSLPTSTLNKTVVTSRSR